MHKRKQKKSFKSKLILKSNEVRVELTSSADDNEDAPDSPISFPFECKMNSNVLRASLNLKSPPDSTQ